MDINWKSPWVLGGGALLLIVLVASRSGGSSDAGLGVASQSVATSANVQLGGLATQLQMEQDQTGAAIDVARMQTDTSNLGLALGYLQNNDNNFVALQNIDAGVHVNDANNSTLLRLTSANNDTFKIIAPQLATISANNSQALASIGANEAITIATINANAILSGQQMRGNQQLTGQAVSTGAGLLGGLFSGIGSAGGIMNFLGL